MNAIAAVGVGRLTFFDPLRGMVYATLSAERVDAQQVVLLVTEENSEELHQFAKPTAAAYFESADQEPLVGLIRQTTYDRVERTLTLTIVKLWPLLQDSGDQS